MNIIKSAIIQHVYHVDERVMTTDD